MWLHVQTYSPTPNFKNKTKKCLKKKKPQNILSMENNYSMAVQS